jgi:hypothetical protein
VSVRSSLEPVQAQKILGKLAAGSSNIDSLKDPWREGIFTSQNKQTL